VYRNSKIQGLSVPGIPRHVDEKFPVAERKRIFLAPKKSQEIVFHKSEQHDINDNELNVIELGFKTGEFYVESRHTRDQKTREIATT